MTVTAQQVGRTVEGWVWWVLSRTSLYTLPTMGKPRDAGWKTEIGMNHTSDLSLCTPCWPSESWWRFNSSLQDVTLEGFAATPARSEGWERPLLSDWRIILGVLKYPQISSNGIVHDCPWFGPPGGVILQVQMQHNSLSIKTWCYNFTYQKVPAFNFLGDLRG
jgi:hypothetical protein